MPDDSPAEQISIAPFPAELVDFSFDPRVAFDRVSQSYQLEDERGEEWEWIVQDRSGDRGRWVPIQQQDNGRSESSRHANDASAEDESEAATTARRKRRRAEVATEEAARAKKQKADKAAQNKAIYITSLPVDIDEEELHQVFSRFGMIAESTDTDKPRIKLYYDDDGNFKGEALIVYFRPESVGLAIDLMDETDFRMGQPVATGPMRVREADTSFKREKTGVTEEATSNKTSNAYRQRQKAIKKTQEMNSRLADWDDDDPSALPQTSSRWDKVVVLKHMFTIEAINADPGEILDIKEDIREEAEKYGTVTNVVLFDKEEDGVVTVRFSDARAAQACAKEFHGRSFEGRSVDAYIADGKEKFRKSGKNDVEEEAERLQAFGDWLENGGNNDE